MLDVGAPAAEHDRQCIVTLDEDYPFDDSFTDGNGVWPEACGRQRSLGPSSVSSPKPVDLEVEDDCPTDTEQEDYIKLFILRGLTGTTDTLAGTPGAVSRASSKSGGPRTSSSFYCEDDSHTAARVAGDFGVTVAGRVLSMISFADKPELLRAVPVSSIMRGWGIWKDSRGSAETFALSLPANGLDTFISHNWGVSPLKKFLATAYHFNLLWSFWASLFACVVATVLTMLEVLPSVVDRREPGHCYRLGFMARLVSIPVLVLVLFFGRSIARVFGLKGPLVFLDKICIDQVDEEAQRQGISKLGAFLRKSDDMLVLYSKPYLTRVWTVYEVAAFLVQHPVHRMKVLPITLPAVLCVEMMICLVVNICILEIRANGGSDAVAATVLLLAGAIYLLPLRRWCKEKQHMQDKLKNFSVRDCSCTLEADRSVVYQNIFVLLKVFHKIPKTATMSEALNAFDLMVQQELPQAFKTAWAYCTLSYGQLLVLSFCLSGGQFFDTLAAISLGRDTRAWTVSLLVYPMFLLVIWPGMMLVQEFVASLFLSAKGMREVLWVIACMFFPAVPTIPSHILLGKLEAKARDSDEWLRVLIVLAILPCVFAVAKLLQAIYANGPAKSGVRRTSIRTSVSSNEDYTSEQSAVSSRAPSSTSHKVRWMDTVRISLGSNSSASRTGDCGAESR